MYIWLFHLYISTDRLYDSVSQILRLICLHSINITTVYFDDDIILWLKSFTPSSTAALVSNLGGREEGVCSNKSHKVFCKNSQLYILRELGQLYKQDDLHTAFLPSSLLSFPPPHPKCRAVQKKLRPQRVREVQNKQKKKQ